MVCGDWDAVGLSHCRTGGVGLLVSMKGNSSVALFVVASIGYVVWGIGLCPRLLSP